LTVENYAKAIYQICAKLDGQPAATGQIAVEMGVAPGTVTSMLKTLSDAALATYTPYEGVRLTPAGDSLALRVMRRHRLIELFLVRTLDLTWDEVHEEAEHMEHAVSDLLIDRIDEFLGHPEADPHGDPIPRSDLSFSSPEGRCLSQCQPGERFQLARVLDQSPEFLRYLSEAGISLATRGEVLENQAEAAVVSIEVDGRRVTLGHQAAEKILVTVPVA
jgi:DtxR family Mn-dependent transcriptional regulator